MQKDHAGVVVPPPLIFVTPLIVATFVQRAYPWPIVRNGATLLVIGAFMLVAIGVSIGLASVVSFRRAHTTVLPMGRPTTSIVESGPYGYSRNPMYVAMALGFVGLALLLNNAWALITLPVILLVIDVFVIRREEQYLSSKFGKPYRDYCSRVRRWL